jgi:hypothetical protein
MHTEYWSENLKGRDHFEDLCIDGRILEWILKKLGGRVRTGFTWLRTGTSGQALVKTVMSLWVPYRNLTI